MEPEPERHLCLGQGLLVSSDHPLPSEPWDHLCVGPGASDGAVGCNHLTCVRCGACVRSVAHRRWNSKVDSPLALYAALGDAHHLNDAGERTPFRVYVCRCDLFVADGLQALCDPLSISGDGELPWRCAGHPPLALPAVVDGVALPGPKGWRATLRRLLSDARPDGRPLEHRTVLRWYHCLDRAEAQALLSALLELFDEGSPRVRAEVLALFIHRPWLPGAEGLVAALARWQPPTVSTPKEREAFERERTQPYDFSVEDCEEAALWVTAARLLSLRVAQAEGPEAAEERALLWRWATTPPGIGGALVSLVGGDWASAWAHRSALLAIQPSAWAHLLRLAPRAALPTTVAALLAEGTPPAEVRALAQGLPDSDPRKTPILSVLAAPPLRSV